MAKKKKRKRRGKKKQIYSVNAIYFSLSRCHSVFFSSLLWPIVRASKQHSGSHSVVPNWFKYHVLSRGRPYAHVRPRRSTREHLRWIWRCFSPREPHFCPPVTMGFSTSELYLSLSLSLFIPLLSFSLYHPASLRSYAFSRSLSRASIWYPVIIPRLSTRESLSLSPSLSLSLPLSPSLFLTVD